MDRKEFHRRYLASDLEHIELIEGIVYMPSPVRAQGHAREQSLIFVWLDQYAAGQEGVVARTPATILLDDQNEPEPDAMLYRETEDSYRDGYLVKAPELVVGIAASTFSRDLHQKKAAYERNGVREYLVWRTEDCVIDWFRFAGGQFQAVFADDRGIIESAEFPGLRLDVDAMLALDRKRVLRALASA